ncbi:MAG: hypothetical protein IPI02_23065 [Sterolibacteriaceae bacterium]|nr:hypothetical protein [Sterolibacteriaceae bacterium]
MAEMTAGGLGIPAAAAGELWHRSGDYRGFRYRGAGWQVARAPAVAVWRAPAAPASAELILVKALQAQCRRLLCCDPTPEGTNHGPRKRRPARGGQRVKKHQYRELRQQLTSRRTHCSCASRVASRLSPYQSVERCHARTEAVTEQARVFRPLLPTLLKRLRQIQDTRNPEKAQAALVGLMLPWHPGVCPALQLTAGSQHRYHAAHVRHNLRLLYPGVGQFAPCR